MDGRLSPPRWRPRAFRGALVGPAQAGAEEPMTPPEFETLSVTTQGAIGRLTLDRPEGKNALNLEILQELAQAADWLNKQPELRVVIVSGRGRWFSPGADLKDLPGTQALPDSGKAWLERREIGQAGLRMADAIERIRAITIAQVHGVAIGGGLVLMLACDLRVVAEDTVFSIPEVELGIPLAWGGIPRLVREIGPAMTKELVITCRRFTPREAQRLGAVNRVVPAEKLEAEVEALAREVAEKPPVPVVITKEHVNAATRAMTAGLDGFADGDVLMGFLLDPDAREAGRAYRERHFGRKREPSD